MCRLERQGPGSHLIETTPKENRFGSRVKVFAQRLFRRHVSHGADGHARTSEVLVTRAKGFAIRLYGFFRPEL